MSVAVMSLDSSLARNTKTLATSPMVATRPMGCRRSKARSAASGFPAFSFTKLCSMGESTVPGETVLTLML